MASPRSLLNSFDLSGVAPAEDDARGARSEVSWPPTQTCVPPAAVLAMRVAVRQHALAMAVEVAALAGELLPCLYVLVLTGLVVQLENSSLVSMRPTTFCLE